MGVCASRDKVPLIDGAHEDEQFCYAAECTLNLHSVEYRTFQAAIKRYGYRIDLSEDHLKEIAPDINLSIQKMHGDEASAYHLVYLDRDFAYKNETHNIEELMMIGWLLCRHWDDENQATELWHLINPEVEDFVTKKQVMHIVNRLAYIAVQLNRKIVLHMRRSSERDSAVEYLDRCMKRKKAFLLKIQNQLPDLVEKEQLYDLMEQFFRSYDLRLAIAGDKKLDSENES